jgi:hypothetical protein
MNDIKRIIEVRLTHGHHRYLFLVDGVRHSVRKQRKQAGSTILPMPPSSP